MSAHLVETLPFRALDRNAMRAFVVLHRLSWPDVDEIEVAVERRLRAAAEADSERKADELVHFVRDGARLIAVARSFRRVVATGDRRFGVLALASVCSDPARRGEGLGAAVVRAAWERLDDQLPVSFFQTGVPDFYLRLGSRVVDNPIVDSSGAERLFWEPHAMIYPAPAPWPQGPIDLLGGGW